MTDDDRRVGTCGKHCAVVDECEARGDVIRALRAENAKLLKWKNEDTAAMRVFERYRELEAEIERLRAENARLREATLEEAAKAAEGFPKNREWVPGSLYDTLRREVAQDIRRLK